MSNPYLPKPRPDDGNHITIIALAGKPAMCRLCGAAVLPSGRTSKRKKFDPALLSNGGREK